jgi:hypothetical protein
MRNKTNQVLRSILKTAVCFLDQSGEVASDARDRVAAGFDRASDRVSDFGDRASDRLSDLGERASSRLSDVGDRVRGLYRGDDTAKNALMFAAGVAVGACAGILLAPASGEETREAIGDKVHEFRGQVRKFSRKAASSTGTE